ncbi:MAG: nucleotidyltransferase domain-containing protein [Firmicutes bacterium]|nr:nucleotidyltransferase domain-containing protein [Bacillota bacterium]
MRLMISGLNPLRETDKKAVVEFCTLLRRKLKDNLRQIRLFGSKARGDDDPESDIDILLLVEKRDPVVEDQIIDIAYEVSLKYDVVMMPVVLSVDEYLSSLSRASLFYRHTQNEGLVL